MTDKGVYQLIIGNHVLVGEKQILKKPLIVIQPTEDVEPVMGVDDLRSSVCEVRGVVREKLLFKKRPNISVGALGDDSEDDKASGDRERTRC